MSQSETPEDAIQLRMNLGIDAGEVESASPVRADASPSRLLQAFRSVGPHERLRRSLMRAHALLYADEGGSISSAYRSDLGQAVSAFLKHAEDAQAGRSGRTGGDPRGRSFGLREMTAAQWRKNDAENRFRAVNRRQARPPTKPRG